MRRRMLLLAGALFLVLGCGKDSTTPQPDPKPRPVPPATGMVAPGTAPDSTVPTPR